ncbi:MAG: hypothetical protein R6U95_00820 [Bacteroidales bacterium]
MHTIMKGIMTGHKLLLFIIMLFVFLSCDLFRWDKSPDYEYLISYNNLTSDTVIITMNKGGFLSSFDLRERIVYPDSMNIYTGGMRGVQEGEDPIEKVFSEWSGLDSCWIYVYDDEMRQIANQEYDTINGLITPNRNSLLKVWDAPLREMGDSINHFFNYNSWKSWLVDDNEGIVQFTIYESDFE